MLKYKLALAAAVLLAVFFTGCDSSENPSTVMPSPKIIEETYRMSNAAWFNAEYAETGTITAGETAITGAGINFSGVFTRGGGKFTGGEGATFTSGMDGSWAYIYDDSGKLGIALFARSVESIVFLGKSFIDSQKSLFNEIGINADTGGMQDKVNGSNSNWHKRYAVCVTDTAQTISLPALQGEQIEGEPAKSADGWLTVTPEQTEGDVPKVKIGLSEWRQTGLVINSVQQARAPSTKDSVIVQAGGGTRLLLVVNQSHTEQSHTHKDTAANFATDWENLEDVLLYDYNGDPIDVNLPWAPSYSITFLPDMRKDVKKADGWQFAFYLFDPAVKMQKFNYFGLYNKYTGMLRVFFYQPTVKSEGGELSILTTPTNRSTPKIPYYHSWLYGIPMNHTDMQNSFNPFHISSNTQETFQNLIAPYAARSPAMFQEGWYAFDMDFSAYQPGERFAGDDGISFNGQTHQDYDITIMGTIDASIGGTFDYTYTAPTAPQSTASTGAIGVLSDVATAFAPVAADIGTGNYAGAIAKAIAGGLNLDVKYSGKTGGSPGKGQGNINLALTGEISLQGYMTGFTSNDIMNTGFEYGSDFKNTVQGVWSLQTDPVLCVLNDLVIVNSCDTGLPGEEGWNNGLKVKNNDESGSGRKSYTVNMQDWDWMFGGFIIGAGFRLVSFLDPNSIKINLNTALFKDISDINVEWMLGVYPNQTPGHTNNYRASMGIPKTGNIDAKTEDWWTQGQLQFTLSRGNSKMPNFVSLGEEHQPSNPLFSPDIESGTLTMKSVDTGISKYKIDFYGQPLSDAPDTSINFFMLDPQVSLPYYEETVPPPEPDYFFYTTVLDPIVPDYVLWVMLSFKYKDADGNEQIGMFSKRFLPTVKVISTNDLQKTYKPQIKDYIKKTAANETIQTVNGKNVTHKDNGKMLYKINKVIDTYDEHPNQ